jgi:hypothetical protein
VDYFVCKFIHPFCDGFPQVQEMDKRVTFIHSRKETGKRSFPASLLHYDKNGYYKFKKINCKSTFHFHHSGEPMKNISKNKL